MYPDCHLLSVILSKDSSIENSLDYIKKLMESSLKLIRLLILDEVQFSSKTFKIILEEVHSQASQEDLSRTKWKKNDRLT